MALNHLVEAVDLMVDQEEMIGKHPTIQITLRSIGEEVAQSEKREDSVTIELSIEVVEEDLQRAHLETKEVVEAAEIDRVDSRGYQRIPRKRPRY